MMISSVKKTVITFVGGFLAILGAIFILIPGPAFLVLPTGLAILSLEYDWAKVWLKQSQRWMRQAAVKTDAFVLKMKRFLKK